MNEPYRVVMQSKAGIQDWLGDESSKYLCARSQAPAWERGH